MEISSPDKLLFTNPPITKRQIADYYLTVADRILPYLYDRALSLVVCPQGVKSECFYKKNPAPIIVNSVSDLIMAVQNNTLEFHIWGSIVSDKERPDIMVFDLDPDEGLGLFKVRRGVRDLKSVLDTLNLKSFLKTSGGKGYHIVVPFKRSADWEEFSRFAKTIAIYMEQKWSNRYTSNVRKSARKGKIFIDWIRNSRAQTSVAPYSVRAKSGATVSMPIAWKDLSKIAPNSVTIAKAVKLIKKSDPWIDFYKVKQKLAKTQPS